MKTTLKICIVVTMLFVSEIFAQFKPNSLYFEIFGNGGLYSINYDRLFTPTLGARIGFMYFSADNSIFDIDQLILVPIMLNYFVGEGSSKLELGAGIVFGSLETDFWGLTNESSSTAVIGTATVGYRYQPVDGGFMFRAGFTPLFSSGGFLASGGLSIGVAF
jgi:hypothetical protein